MTRSGPRYRLGCPVWACPDWVGGLYSTTNRRRWLGEYSSVFGAVEVNGSFYAMPTIDNARLWASEAADGFEFVMKVPAAITHERQLVGVESLTEEFVAVLRELIDGGCSATTLLQLPPFFAAAQLPALERFLAAWPRGLPIAVEVRHPDYFDDGPNERALLTLLTDAGAERALFDSRPLFSAPPTDDIERRSQGRKPRSPFRTTAIGDRPMVRLVGRNDLATIDRWLDEWSAVVARWIGEGRRPTFFTHAPDDRLAPAMAERFHAALTKHVAALPPLPTWPGRAAPKQQSLF